VPPPPTALSQTPTAQGAPVPGPPPPPPPAPCGTWTGPWSRCLPWTSQPAANPLCRDSPSSSSSRELCLVKWLPHAWVCR
jgi:hypothetical protein